MAPRILRSTRFRTGLTQYMFASVPLWKGVAPQAKVGEADGGAAAGKGIAPGRPGRCA